MLYSFLQYGYTWNRKAEERVTAALLAAEDILDEDVDMEEGSEYAFVKSSRHDDVR
jgi:hypothetical protein